MVLRAVVPLALVLLASGCGESAFDGTTEQRVQLAAERGSSRVPAKLGDDLTMVGVKADGRTLVMQFDTTMAGSVDSSPQALSKLFRKQVCDNAGYRSVIDAGGSIRFEISRSKTGEALPQFGIAQCS